jgi:uncharacterized protein
MSEKIIPEHVDPYRLAEQGIGLTGILNLADMPRLCSNLHQSDQKASIELRFGMDEQGLTFLKGHLETQVTLQCQRCMEPFVYEIISDFVLGIVNTLDEANALPDHYEPALTQDGNLALRELIEDEIILNLPIIPRHEADNCKVKLPLTDAGWEESKGDNPFQVLELLKNQKQ